MQPFPRSLLALTLLVGAATAQEKAPAPRASRALLVGCTEYPYLKEGGSVPGSNTIELRGPTNDVELFARALREVYGVPDSAMTRLTGWPADEKARPTKANIQRGFQKLAAEAKPGDWVVIFLAGHGSQQPSSSASLDDETDGLDEIFLPADVRPAADGAKVPNALVDDEIELHLAAIQKKGAEIWLVVDACHSGTLLRGGDYAVRGLPGTALGLRGAAGSASAQPAAAAAPTARRSTEGIAAFYGAQSFGSAPEMELPEGAGDARPQGLFTFLLAKEMHRVGASATYNELSQRVIAAYQSFPCHLTVPMAEGDLDRAVGGGGRLTEPPMLVEFGPGALRLNQGLILGIENGTELAVIADGAPVDAEPIARIEVVDAGTYDAECALRSGTLPTGAGTLRALVVKRPIGQFTLVVAVESVTGAPVARESWPESLRALLTEESGHFRVTSDTSEADWRVVFDGPRVHLLPAGHLGTSDVLDLAPSKVALRLGHIRRATGLRRVCGLFGAPDSTFDVWAERRVRGSASGARLEAGDRLVPGDELRVCLKKSGGGIVDANVYYIDGNDNIQRLFPGDGQSPRLEPKAGAEFELVRWTPVIDDALGVESLWVLAVPRNPSDPVLELRDLSQDPTTTRGITDEKAARGLLEELLAPRVTRGLAAQDEAPAKKGSVFQVPLHTAWGEVGPPAWKSADPEQSEVPHPFLAGLPVTFDAGPCFEFAKSPASGGRNDVLVLGGPEGTRAVLVDFAAPTAPSATNPADFEPEAAFLFFADGRRLALYDRRDRGSFDLAVLDADGDGTGETRWTRDAEEWILHDGVRTPWLSQAHLTAAVLGQGSKAAPVATARLSVLSRGRRP